MNHQSELAQSIVRRYLTMHRYQHRASHHLRKAFGVGGRGIAVLHLLFDQGPRTVGQISCHLDVRNAAISPLLDHMEREGWVSRCRCAEDARKVIVSATDKGCALAEEAPRTMVGKLRERLPELPEAELEVIDAALARLIALADMEEPKE